MSICRGLKRDLIHGARILAVFTLALGGRLTFGSQHKAWQADKYPFRRPVQTARAGAKTGHVAVTEFFAHGALADSESAVRVYSGSRPCPTRLMQRGPGDRCRVAFQTAPGETNYQVYYGADAATDDLKWDDSEGLVWETRSWRPCNLNDLSSVQKAFQAGAPVGRDYVSSIFQRYHRLAQVPGPFLSHYRGPLHVPSTGSYTFFTSSQDCSFLLIDGKQVVAAPGRHGPVGQARFKGSVQLTAGRHRIEYWHAAAGLATCAVAAWQLPGADKLQVIPPAAFGSDRIERIEAGAPESRQEGPLPDLQLALLGDAQLPGSDAWAVRVQFRTAHSPAQRSGRCRWQFGDGQTSDQWEPTHVFLHTGTFDIEVSVRRRGKDQRLVNRVLVTRPTSSVARKEVDTFPSYLPLINTYDPTTLDGESLWRLIVFRVDAEQWTAALAAGDAVLGAPGSQVNDEVRWRSVRLLAPVAKVRLRDAATTLELWKAAGKSIERVDWRAICAVRAADVAINELLDAAAAEPFLAYAASYLADRPGVDGAAYYRVRGDAYARLGRRDAALAAYRTAMERLSTKLSATEAQARRGAYSRSAEAFLRDGDLYLAWVQLDRWQREFPDSKLTGYLTLLQAQYALACKRTPVAIALAEDGVSVNPHSAYADQLVMLQATAAEQKGDAKRAAAALQSLISDYPGSPLVSKARRRLAELMAER